VDGTSFEVPQNNELSELKGKPSVIAIEVDESGRSGDVSKLFAFLFGACQLVLIILYGMLTIICVHNVLSVMSSHTSCFCCFVFMNMYIIFEQI
jgi:hypothetical protein